MQFIRPSAADDKVWRNKCTLFIVFFFWFHLSRPQLLLSLLSVTMQCKFTRGNYFFNAFFFFVFTSFCLRYSSTSTCCNQLKCTVRFIAARAVLLLQGFWTFLRVLALWRGQSVLVVTFSTLVVRASLTVGILRRWISLATCVDLIFKILTQAKI